MIIADVDPASLGLFSGFLIGNDEQSLTVICSKVNASAGYHLRSRN
jgi:hypothetical protein